MLVVITVHMEYYSLFSVFAWERIGLISSAEGFVALSGIVLGIVYNKRMLRDGFKSSALKLWKRSFQLYRINLFVILSIALLRLLPFVDVFEVTNWVPITEQDKVFPLYPPWTTPWFDIVKQALLLRIGPHQFQVIGLYVGLLAIAPLILYCLQQKKTVWLVLASCTLFWVNQKFHYRITGARFEWGFPTLTWQLLFIFGMVVGYHHKAVLDPIADGKSKILIILAVFLSLTFLILALNNPNAIFWPLRDLAYLDSAFFHNMYMSWFQKSTLGLGRILNNIALFIVFYFTLSRYWLPVNKALGWLLIPLGQSSLYVFILHIYFIVLFSNIPLENYSNIWVNTAIHASTTLLIWGMVKRKFLFKFIPK